MKRFVMPSDTMNIDAELARRIRSLRGYHRVSQKELAKLTGINPTRMWRIETGEYSIFVTELKGIAEFFGCSPWDLVDHEFSIGEMKG